MSQVLEIYTDGSCRVSEGSGGWGVVILKDINNPIKLSGRQEETTNNRMELQAAIEALKAAKDLAKEVKIYTDSRYVMDGFERGYLKKWMSDGWVTSKGHPVKNQDQWVTLLDLTLGYSKVHWEWVKGHSGNRFNTICDNLAKGNI